MHYLPIWSNLIKHNQFTNLNVSTKGSGLFLRSNYDYKNIMNEQTIDSVKKTNFCPLGDSALAVVVCSMNM